MTTKKNIQRQSIARNSTYTIVSQVIINVVGVFVVGYIARKLGDVDYGKYVFAFAFVQTFSSMSNMGIHVVQMREIAKDKEQAPAFFGATLIFRVIFAVVTYLLIAVVISMLDYPDITKEIVYIAGLTLIFLYISDTCIATFRGYESMHYSAGINIGTTLFSMGIRTLAIYLGYRLLVLSWTTTLVSLVTAVVSYYFIRRYFFTPKFKMDVSTFKNIFALTLPFYAMHIFMDAYKRIDVVLLSFLKGDAHVGWYNAAAIMVLRLAFFPSAISGAIFPVMTRLVADGKKQEAEDAYRNGLFILLLLACPISIGYYFFAKTIILLIYDEGFFQAIHVLKLLALTIPMIFLTFHMQNALFSLGKEKIVTKIIGSYTVLSVLLNLILIPKYGCVGAALSVCFAQTSNLLLNLYILKYHLKVRSFDRRTMKLLIASILTVAALVLVREENFFLMLAVWGGSYSILLVVLGLIRKSTLSEFRNMLLKNE
jgi:O-antigen/teichoic acid export membrane protein